MRVQIFSDLHIEYRSNPLPSVYPHADVVVLAGDLAPVRTDRIGEVMRAWRWPDLLYVPGNLRRSAHRARRSGGLEARERGSA